MGHRVAVCGTRRDELARLMKSNMTDSHELHGKFCDIELETRLFDIEVDGVPIWERIRFPVYRDIESNVMELGTAHDSISFDSSDYARGLYLWLRNTVYRNPFFAGSHDVLVWGHPRRKQRDDGRWWDIYCDPLYEACDLDVTHFEPAYQNHHLTPPRTESLRYLDLIEYTGTIFRKTGLVDRIVPEAIEEKLHSAEESFKDCLNIEPDLVSYAEYELSKRQSTYKLYEHLIDRINPVIAVVVVSYGKETFIEICKENQIPVVELQHGVINPQHVGYAYPENHTKETFPNYLLTFGEFWANSVEFPIPDDQVISVGYPYLEESIDQYDDVESAEQLLFISQGTIGEQLSKFAMEVNQHPKIDFDIVYKLHPGEYDQWKVRYPWLTEANFEIVDNPDRQLYKLFAESSAQIGVGSTALYEGLAFGLETFVYDCPGSAVSQPLVEEGSANLICSVEELVSSLGKGEESFDCEYYFESDAAEQACRMLNLLLNKTDHTNT